MTKPKFVWPVCAACLAHGSEPKIVLERMKPEDKGSGALDPWRLRQVVDRAVSTLPARERYLLDEGTLKTG